MNIFLNKTLLFFYIIQRNIYSIKPINTYFDRYPDKITNKVNE
ncbi:hypothetical protein XBO1_2250019 [Xenorhabdus bovienii str. oregonense]|uniref:Uncharacterized protein n=1 Tax=Xenorhabdus bovienii str. oregonense TaxID=1398202 RepID=A0A077P6W3_XENBV|nr:hypothetical protein XBO1_2250019 [Xenorhabdus bovienii str. oregonense]